MAKLINQSVHPLVLGNVTIQPGETIEDFSDEDAENLKDSLFVKAKWLVVEIEPKPKGK